MSTLASPRLAFIAPFKPFLREFGAVLLPPLGLLMVGMALAWLIDGMPMDSMLALIWAPPIFSLAGAVMGWRLHRTRGSFVLLCLGIAGAVYAGLLTGGVDDGPTGQVIYAALAILLPLNLAVFPFLAEKGLFTGAGVNRLGLILLQMLVIAFIGAEGEAEGTLVLQKAAAEVLHFRILHHDYDYWSYLPQPAILVFAIAAPVLLVRAVKVRQPMEAGYLIALVSAFLALHQVGQGSAPPALLLGGIAAMIAALFQESYHMAFRDELTGLPARRALMADLRNLGDDYALAMGDIDKFKSFNDTYGHDVGDQVLRMVAQKLATVGGGGRAYRYGGEEFTIVFPGKTAKEAAPFLDEVRQTIEAARFRIRAGIDRRDEATAKASAHNGEIVQVTISLGVAHPRGDRPDIEAVMKAADVALYASKDGGRNRVTAAR